MLGAYYLKLGQIPMGERRLREGLTLAISIQDLDQQAQAYIELAKLALARQRFDEAMSHAQATYELGIDNKNKRYQHLGLGNIAAIHAAAGRYQEAEPLMLSSIELARENRDQLDEASYLRNLGLLYLKLLNPYGAISALEQSQGIYGDFHIPSDPAITRLVGEIKSILNEKK